MNTVAARRWCYRVFLSTLPLLLISCGESTTSSESLDEPVRGLRAFRVMETANSELRRYPSVVKPANESKLSFQVGGKLRGLSLKVGQRVAAGEVLAELDPVSLELQVEQSRASLAQVRANYANAKSDIKRKTPLRKNGYITQAEYESAQRELKTTLAQVEQAKKQLAISQENLKKTRLLSPFTGVVSSIEVKDFEQVSPGEPILGLYSESAFEVSFSVPAVIINAIKVGDPGRVTFADMDGAQGSGHVKELGSSAAEVSAFPVVLALDEAPEGLKSGMAADVELNIAIGLEGKQIGGFLVPINSLVFADDQSVPDSSSGTVFIYDEASSTVTSRQVHVAGILGNMVIVDEGLSVNDIIANAGVSYLYDGLKVKLLPLPKPDPLF